jgi:hypothetical protein
MRQSYPWESKEARREGLVKFGGFGYVAFGLLLTLVGWLTKEFSPSFGWLFVAYGLGYYFGADAAFRRVEQNY